MFSLQSICMKAGYVHCVKMADLSRCGNLVFFAPEILGKITVESPSVEALNTVVAESMHF